MAAILYYTYCRAGYHMAEEHYLLCVLLEEPFICGLLNIKIAASIKLP